MGCELDTLLSFDRSKSERDNRLSMFWTRGLILLGVAAVAGLVLACGSTLDESLTDLEVGDCVASPDSGAQEINSLDSIDCAEPGAIKVAQAFDLSGASWPGLGVIQGEVTAKCPATTAFTLDPTEDSWDNADDRAVICFVSADEVRVLSPQKTITWATAGPLEELQHSPLQARHLDGVHVLLCKVNDQIYAVKNACMDTILPLEGGYLEDHYLICPWHGCRYDLPTGELLDQPGCKLETFPVKHHSNGTFSIGITKTNND